MRGIPALAIMSATVLYGSAGPANAQAEPDSKVALEELRTAPKPKQQTDLDTIQLASAHRERAESVQEKTNGLWQSWLVSICQGCGPNQKSTKEIYRDSLAVRGGAPGTGPSVDTAEVARPPQASAPERRRAQSSLAGDLSPANVSSIRRMPN